MTFLKGTRNQLKQSFDLKDFLRLGVQAQYVGVDAISLSQNGKPIGHIRKVLGKYVWYPANSKLPSCSDFIPNNLLAKLARRIGKSKAA